jgi:TonB-dependent siderophore receptor
MRIVRIYPFVPTSTAGASETPVSTAYRAMRLPSLAHFSPTPLSLALVAALAFSASRPANSQTSPPAENSPQAPADTASAPVAAQQEVTLPAVKVKAASVRDASTDGTGSYAARATTLGKDTRPLRELPHSVTVITREQLTDQNIVTIEAALKNVTGVTVQRFDATGSYTQFIARGFAADSYQLDGLTVQTDTNGIYFDLAAYDRIEVQRGAASLFSGAGEPGITVNMARKRAPSDFQAEGAVSLGSWNDRRVDLDVGGSLNEAQTLRGRVVGVVQNFDTFMDGIDDNRKRMLYGTLEADLGQRTTLSAGATWQTVDTVLSRGLPTGPDARLLDIPRSTMPVQAWNRQALDSLSAFAELEHRGADDSLLKLSLRHVRRGNEANYLDPSIPAADGTMNALSASAFDREDTDNTADVYYSMPFAWGGQKHQLLVGADYRKSRNDTHWAGSIALPSTMTLNLFHFDPYAIPEPAFDLNASVSRTDVTAYGAYTQLRVKPTQDWTLIGGGRMGTWKSEGVSYGTPTDFETTAKFTPYAAAIYDITPTLSTYGSYSEIFKPQNARTAGGGQIEPRTGRQVELGIKGDSRGGQLAYSAALYRLIDENRAVGDENNPGFSIATGKARAQGVEFDVRGELSRNWSMSGGYAYTDTEYLRSKPAQQGTPVSSITPRHSYNLWARHKIVGGPVGGLVVGAGLRGVSDFFNGSGATMVRGPGYTLFALNLAYPINDHYRIALNVDNLFDKVYWEKVSSPSRQNFFGEPRRITVALRASF